MSKTIDEKIVEMRFDNKHFEQHTRESMSTLDKLKQKLNLTGASKGLENLNTSANKVNFNGMSNSLGTVQAKFSAMEVVGVTALANITNSAINAGKRIANALTLEPIKTGFQEYELKMDSVRTIMASTGESIETVNKYLDELNKYSDETIYKFSDMTQNIGKFTNAGVKLEDAVIAMKGLSNEAAVSGANAEEASRAMYNFAQSLSMGYVQLIDWKSIENANMATIEFKQQLLDTAVACGTVTKASDGMYNSGKKSYNLQQMFKDGLKDQWLTSEVLIETLKKYGDKTTDIGKKAFDAATKVTKFTQMFDILKETAQSGWAKTWEIIIGNIEQARNMLTPLTEFLSKFIDKISDARNKLLEGALGKNFRNLLNDIQNVTKPVQEVVKSLQDYSKVVDEIIAGKWKNAPTRWEDLAAAGYDWAHAQNLVNERLGCSVRHATKYKETQQETATTQEKVNKATADYILELTKMSDAELKAKGYTDEQIKSLRELEKVAKKTGIPLKEFIEKIDEIDGRWILMNSFKNLGMSLVSIFKSIGQALRDVFSPMTSDQLFDIIAGFHKLSTVIRDYVEKNANNLMRTLRGLFSILGFIKDIVGGGLKVAFLVLKEVLKAFGFSVTGILDVTAAIGDAIYYTRQWIKEHSLLAKAIEISVKYIKIAVEAIVDWVKNNETIINTIDKFKSKLNSMKDGIKSWIDGLKEADNIPQYIIQGLVNGLKNGSKIVIEAIIGLGKSLIEGIKGVLGIHSPSTEFFEIGKNIIQGLINGLKSGLSTLWSTIKGIGTKCVEVFNKIDFGKLFAAGIGIGMLVVAKKMVDVIGELSNLANRVTAPLQGLGDALSGIGKYFEDSGKAKKTKAYGEVVRNMALSIALLAGSVYFLSKIKDVDLWKAVGVISALTVIVIALYGLVVFINKKCRFGDSLKISVSIGSIVGIAASLYIAATALKQLSKINLENTKAAIINLTAIIIGLSVLIYTIGKSLDPKKEHDLKKVGKMILSISKALLLLVVVTKLASMLKPEEIKKGIAVIAMFELLVLGLMAVSKVAGDSADKAGKMISKISVSLLIMIGVIKLASMLKPNEITKGLAIITGIGLVFSALIAVSKFAGANAAKAGWMLLGISSSFVILISAIKLISSLSDGQIKRGLKVVTTIGLVFTALIAVSNLAGKNAIKAGSMLLMMSTALLILTGILFILSKMDPKGISKALTIVSVLEILFGGLIAVTYLAKDCMKTLITITTVLTILIAAVIGLSFIDSSKLAAASASISAIMATLALLVASTKLIGNPKDVALTLASLIGAVAALGLIITLMSNFTNPDGVLASAGSLSMLLLSLSVAFAIMSKVGPLAKEGLITLAAMELAVAGLAVIIGILGNNIDPTNAIATSTSLSILLLSMSGALGILSLIGAAWPAALAGIGCLAAFIVAIGGLIVGIGALADKYPQLEEFLDKGIPILEKIGIGLGSFVGGIINGILSSSSKALPEIGTNLSLFMNNITGFIDGARNIDESVVKGVGYLSLAIIALSGAELINGLTNLLSGNSSLALFGFELSNFMDNASGFISAISGINPEVAQGAKNLADAILAITGANLLQSITSWLTGGSSLSDFGTQLGSLGTNLRTFVDSLGEFSEGQVMTIDCAARAIKALAQAAQEIPNEGGWLGKILGENSIGAFGSQLPLLGTNLNQFVTNLGTFTDAQVTTIDCAGRAIKALAKAAQEIPNEGGWAAAICGDNSISTFGNKLPQLGIDLNSFATNLGSFSDAQVTTIDCAGRAIKSLAEAAKNIPNEGGLWAAICGDNSLSTFGNKLPGLGTNLKDFVSNLGTFTDAQVITVLSACNAIRSIAKLGEIDIGSTGSGLESFGNNMVKFSNKVKSFVDKIGEVGSEGIDSAINKTKELVSMAQTVASAGIDSLSTFGESLKKLAKDGVSGFVKELSNSKPKEDAKKAGEEIVNSFKDGLEKDNDRITDKGKSASEKAVDGLKTKSLKSDAESAGKDLAQGLINGLQNSSKKQQIYNAAYALGKLAVQGEKDGQQSHSPSKATEKAGKWLGEGLIIGIQKMNNKVYGAGRIMGEKATNSISNALNTALMLLDSDMDTQPTIRPVLDLSDVESGVGTLGLMFNNGPSIGVAANLRAISSEMNARLQNGANDDVISAINKLSKNLGNVKGDTYNVNGITYDDGSNITDAVKTLVRAAKIERRV